MHCNACGIELRDAARFCQACGQPVSPPGWLRVAEDDEPKADRAPSAGETAAASGRADGPELVGGDAAEPTPVSADSNATPEVATFASAPKNPPKTQPAATSSDEAARLIPDADGNPRTPEIPLQVGDLEQAKMLVRAATGRVPGCRWVEPNHNVGVKDEAFRKQGILPRRTVTIDYVSHEGPGPPKGTVYSAYVMPRYDSRVGDRVNYRKKANGLASDVGRAISEIGQWAAKDPEAAKDWATKNPARPGRPRLSNVSEEFQNGGTMIAMGLMGMSAVGFLVLGPIPAILSLVAVYVLLRVASLKGW